MTSPALAASDQLDRELKLERRVEGCVASRLAEIEAERAAAAAKAAKPRRPQLSAKERSDLIGKIGFDRYRRLPL